MSVLVILPPPAVGPCALCPPAHAVFTLLPLQNHAQTGFLVPRVAKRYLHVRQVVTAATPPESPVRSVTPSPAPSRAASSPPPPAAAGAALPSPGPGDLAGFGPPEDDPGEPPAAPAGGSGGRGADPAGLDGGALQGLVDPEAAARLLAAALPSFWQAALANVQGGAGRNQGPCAADFGPDAADGAPTEGPKGSEGEDAAPAEAPRASSAAAAGAGARSDREPEQAARPGAGPKRQRSAREALARPERRRSAGGARAARSDASSKVRRAPVLWSSTVASLEGA